MSSNNRAVADAMRSAIQNVGLQGLAKALGTTPATLGSYFAGSARRGTVLLLETRFHALPEAKSEARAEA